MEKGRKKPKKKNDKIVAKEAEAGESKEYDKEATIAQGSARRNEIKLNDLKKSEGEETVNKLNKVNETNSINLNEKYSQNVFNKTKTDTIDNNKTRVNVCPYLRTINRSLLDFDFEKLCSVSLSNLHVYACLVCGLYFQGIGKGTYAYIHALEKCHYVFINLETCKTCCVPENYEIVDASLNDIKYFLKPVYTREQVEHLCYNLVLGKSLDGGDFFPGCVGLNNLKDTDYFNVIIQLLCCIIPIRNILLLYENKKNNAKNMISVLSELIKKIYNAKNFKGVVSPHEFLQTVGIESKKNFKIGTKKDPLDFLLWIINKIHKHSERDMRKKKKIINKKKKKKKRKLNFNQQDKHSIRQKIKQIDDMVNENDNSEYDNSKQFEIGAKHINEQETTNEGLDNGNNSSSNSSDNSNESFKHTRNKKIKQKWIYDDLNIIDYCFDGILLIKTKTKQNNGTQTDKTIPNLTHRTNNEKTNPYSNGDNGDDLSDENELSENGAYSIRKSPFRTLSLKLPNTPIFKNTTESNIIPQISIFELLTKYDGETESFIMDSTEPSTLNILKLPKYLIFTFKRFVKNNFFVEKNGTIVNFVIKNLDMKDYVHPNYYDKNPNTKYNLIASIFHSGTVQTGSYKIHVLNQPSNEWYEIEDLHVISILPQLVLLSEVCIQLYQRQDVQLNGEI
ncbi:U4/U6.U5 tri-snRNP-associated protein 2, putative [Hepatocystis sp. ex Piliocolobus tephrosceles]|nr:U4/U6.U5 tri-snRNP-associated protein 2, putative [Hepatocystis sp. ex Piliocolobus tephrosceles]